MALQKSDKCVTITNAIPRDARRVLLPDNTTATSFSTTLPEYDRRHHHYWSVLELPAPMGKLVIDIRDFKQYLQGHSRSCEFSVAKDNGGIDAILVTESRIKAVVDQDAEGGSMVDPGQIGSTIKRCLVCSKSVNDTANTLCSGCKRVNYCGRPCQLVDWPNHRSFCHSVRDLTKIVADVVGDSVADDNSIADNTESDSIDIEAPGKRVTFAETAAAAPAAAALFDQMADKQAEEKLFRMFPPTLSMAERRAIDAEVDELEQLIRDAALAASQTMQ